MPSPPALRCCVQQPRELGRPWGRDGPCLSSPDARNAGQPSSRGEPAIGPDWAGRFPFPERRWSHGRKRPQASRRLQNQPQDLEIAGRRILFFLHEDKTLFTFTGTPCKGEGMGARAPGGGCCRGVSDPTGRLNTAMVLTWLQMGILGVDFLL